MVAADGAGLNINPRGRPGRAPVLVRFRLNSRNHAAVVARARRETKRPRKTCTCEQTEGPAERRTEGNRESDDGSESTTTRWLASNKRPRRRRQRLTRDSLARASRCATCCRGRCTTELHRFFDALANTTDTNDPRPTADLKVRGCVDDIRSVARTGVKMLENA